MLGSAQLSEEAWRVDLNTKRDGPFGFDALNCPLKDRSLEEKERVGELLPTRSFDKAAPPARPDLGPY